MVLARRWMMALLLVGMTGCAHHAVVDDGSSLSFGWPRTGVLINPARVPARGVGFYGPSRWETRGLRYGTDELVSAIVWAGRELDRRHPGAAFAVADLSLAKGGPSAWHRSHQHGRDVDLPFLTRTRGGRALRAQTMRRFDADGALVGAAGTDIVFDVERNWTLVKLLLTNPVADVQYIFVSDDLKQLLIDFATEAKEPPDLVAKASYLLHQPSDSAPHNDHFHVRVYCAVSDLDYGCRDAGTLRWLKKSYKYERPVQRAGIVELLAHMGRTPSAVFAALSGF